MIAVAIYQMVPPSPIVFFFVLGSAFARLNLLLTNQRGKTHRKNPSYAGYDRQRGLDLLQER